MNESARGGTIRLVDLVKRFAEGSRGSDADVVAVDGIDLDIPGGEFFSMLGPSGCGKTTTLRMIAGFEQPTSGQILLDGVDVAAVPPHRRPVNTVFQSYALFPHLSVEDNVGYGLRWQRGLGREEKRRRIAAALGLVQLVGVSSRRPAQLSGGQQQRVALARALVLEPRVLLLDEPLGALDAKLRKALQLELMSLQREVGITFVYVTHDQEEALTMSDRLAVMHEGRVRQCGSPREVYEEPVSAFVADFLGVANLLDVTSTGVGELRLGDFALRARAGDLAVQGRAKAVIRPERVGLGPAGESGENRLPAMVDRLVYLGATSQVVVRLPHGPALQALVTNEGDGERFVAGTPVTAVLPPDAVRLLPLDTEPAAVPDEEAEALAADAGG